MKDWKNSTMYMGIDVGSVSANAVIIDENKKLVAFAILPSGYDHKQTVNKLIDAVYRQSGITTEAIKCVVGTGYGRNNIIGVRKTVTEITCHAAGVHSLFPGAKIAIDIGGQDSKVIRMSPDGKVDSFEMNDKCAAGTGRFLEVMASALEMDLDTFSRCGLNSTTPYKISSTCTVFAESEMVSGIAKGVDREDIAAGIYRAITDRVLALAGHINEEDTVVLTGGVAKNRGLVAWMKKRIKLLEIPHEPQITGALGAALIAMNNG